MKKNTRGEIATLLTLSTLIIIGLSSLVSSFFLKNKQTATSKAQDVCSGYRAIDTAQQACGEGNVEKVVEISLCWRCKSTPAQPPQGTECTDGQWRTECTSPRQRQSCPANAGVENAWLCINGQWVYQNPGCTVRCAPENEIKEGQPTPTPQLECVSKKAGEIINPNVRTECDINLGEIVNIKSFCDEYGRVWEVAGSSTGRPCSADQLTPTYNKGAVVNYCVRQVCDPGTKKYVCVESYWIDQNKIGERTGTPTNQSCDAKKPVITDKPQITWGPMPTGRGGIIFGPTAAAPKTDGSEGAICRLGEAKCKQGLICKPSSSTSVNGTCVRPTAAPGGGVAPPAAPPPSAAGRCTDNFGGKIACPQVVEASHPNDPNKKITKYVNCNPSTPSDPNASCDLFCVYKDDPTKRAECYTGQFGTDTDFLWWGPVNSFKIGIINLSNKPVTINKVVVYTQFSIGSIDTGSPKEITPNKKLNKNENYVLDTGVGCGLLAPAGGRKVFVSYTIEGSDTSNTIGPIFSNCDNRLVISIK